jgi:multicomponent K+:H+ antiporter subunit C
MESLIAISIGVLVSCGVFLILRARTFPVVVGLALFSYAVNLYLFATGRFGDLAPPIPARGAPVDPRLFVDPIPQALILTAIVIGFGMTAFIVVLSLRSYLTLGSDHVDGPSADHDAIAPTNPQHDEGRVA